MGKTFAGLLLGGMTLAVSGQTVTDTNLTVDTVISTGLSQPTAMAFIGPTSFLVCERTNGRVRYVKNFVLQATPVLDLTVSTGSERGLLGIAVDPNFDTNHYVFFYYSHAAADAGAWVENRLVRYTWDTGTETLGSPLTLLTFGMSAMGNGPVNNGGALQFGPDGMLYGVTGDLNRNGLEQNNAAATAAGVGGIFRINNDGTIPADNPFLGGGIDAAFNKLYAYGIRNSYGLAFDARTGELWDTENGVDTWDEINFVPRRFNSGWKDIQGPSGGNISGLYLVNDNARYLEPKFNWQAVVVPTSCAFLNSAQFGLNNRDAFIAASYDFSALYLYPMNATRDGFELTGGLSDLIANNATERDLVKFGSSFSGVTDTKLGPDGNLYVVCLNNGRIYRIRPKIAPNTISGKVILDTFAGKVAGAPLTLELKTGSTVVETVSTTVTAYGDYYASFANAGSFDVVAKAGHWLAEKHAMVTVGPGTKLDWAMAGNGDLFPDNRIDLFDVTQVLTGWGDPSGDADGSGLGDIFDLNMVLINFGLVGAS